MQCTVLYAIVLHQLCAAGPLAGAPGPCPPVVIWPGAWIGKCEGGHVKRSHQRL